MDISFANDQTFVLTLDISNWKPLYPLGSCIFRSQIRTQDQSEILVYSFSSNPPDQTPGAISYITSTGANEVLSIPAPGGISAHSYVPGDIIFVAGGTFTSAASIIVTNTGVVSASIYAGGTGGIPGAQTVGGTTGTGVFFQAVVTISAGGTMTAVNSI